MPFCYSPWTNIDISPQGGMSPCCKFRMGDHLTRFNIQDSTVDDYVNSEFLQTLKQQFLNGDAPHSCRRCWTEEQHGIKSKRLLDAERWEEHYKKYDLDSNKFITASIAFGNTCNLKCLPCNSYSSSRWQQEYLAVHGRTFAPVHFYKNTFVEEMIQTAPDLIHIDIPGGEPFLSGVDEQQRLLDYYISTKQASNMSLHYTTNVTIFPEESWWSRWKHFAEVDLQLSIDGVGAHNEYIRYPSNWKDIDSNITQFLLHATDNIKLSVSHTLSAYNVYYLDLFVAWCYNKKLPTPWIGQVTTPQYMQPAVWPSAVCEVIATKLSNSPYDNVRQWGTAIVSNNQSQYFDEFKMFLHKHDSYRNVSFAETFPELAQYIND